MGGIGVSNSYHQDTTYSDGWVERSQKAQETEGTKGTTMDPDGNGNVIFTEQVHILRSAPPIPSLAAPANLTSLERNDYYQSIYEKFGLANARTLSHGNSVMFDIYAMMAIIQEIGQKMRNVMRMLRKVENQAIYLNIKQQAAIQREAAWTSMIVGVVMAAVQFVMMGKGLRDQIKGVRMQAKGAVNSGAEMAREQSMLTKVGGDRNLAARQFNLMSRGNPDLEMATEMPNYNAALKAQGGANVANKTKLGPLRNDVNKTTLELNAARSDLAMLEKAGAPASKINAARAKVTQAEVAQSKAIKQYDAAHESKMELHKAALRDVNSYGIKYEDARKAYETLKLDPKADPKQVAAAKAEMQVAGDQYKMARAKQVNYSADMQLKDETYNDVTIKANENLDAFKANEAGHKDTITSQSLTIHGQMILMFSQCLGTMAQSLIQGIRDIISAKATEMQAEQKVIEEQFDQIKDLFSLQQSVIQKAIDTLGSIFSREAGINDQIWRA